MEMSQDNEDVQTVGSFQAKYGRIGSIDIKYAECAICETKARCLSMDSRYSRSSPKPNVPLNGGVRRTQNRMR